MLFVGGKGRGLLCVLVLALSTWASAQLNVRTEGPKLFVNDLFVLQLRASVGGATPDQRVQALANRLRSLPTLAEVRTERVGRNHRVLLNGNPWLLASVADARAGNTTTAALAGAWAGGFRRAMALPPLRLETTSVRLTGGAARTLGFIGRRAHVAVVESSDEAVATVERRPGQLRIVGRSFGQANIAVSADGIVQTIEVRVQPVAASFPQSVTASVTGVPALSSTVEGAIRGAIRAQLRTQPGATLRFNVGEPRAIGAGESATVPVRVAVSAPDAIQAEGVVNVAVRNLPVARPDEAELWYCNDPENVRQIGQLFAAPLRPGIPARMLYHHINMSSMPLYVTVQILNDSDRPARVQIIPGDSPPDRNPVLVGLIAGFEFLRGWTRSSAEVVTIPPRSVIPLSLRRLAPLETMSGLAYLRLVDPDAPQLIVRTDAKLPEMVQAQWPARQASDAPWRETGPRMLSAWDRSLPVLSSHIYPDPFKDEQYRFDVGGRWLFIRIGQKPIPNFDQVKKLDGNFGVIYRLQATVANPTQAPAEVEVVFEASAGYSGALFLLNGEMIRTPLLQPKTEARLARIRLEPGQSRTLNIQTIPLSGSSYPASLAIRPIVR